MKPLSETRQGDVLRWPSGALRVVRVFHDHGAFRDRYKRKPLRWKFCFFAIRRCSWTQRPYTVLNLGELQGLGVVNTGINVKFKTTFDKQLAAEMVDKDVRTIKCCAVKGLP